MTAIRPILLAVALIPAFVSAAQPQDIELNDGSRIRAEVISLNQGSYTLRSETLGEIRIPAAKVKSITTPGSTDAKTAGSGSGHSQVDGIRRSLVQDPEAMRRIESLQNDPLVKDILNDEATMRAINTGDLDALMNNPKVKALMEHSTVQDIKRGGGF